MKRRLRYSISATMIALLFGITVYAQQVIRGTLRSPSGEPLIGATVTVKGTNKSVTTDANGQFSINAPAGSTLVVSSVGFQGKEIEATGTDINETLQVTNATLNEVVVIGYQTVRRRDLTGAASVVNTQQAQRVVGNSVAEQLQGLAAGVTVRNSGAPGSNPRVEIRGVASFTSTDPLYVIDGMIADANSTINPNDIESIQVLKDASAAAIYGSRAANGVVIVTTKQGRAGTAKVGASVRYSIQKIPKLWDVMNAREFAAVQKQQYINSGATPLASVDAAFDPNIDTDWQDAVFRTGHVQDYTVSLSGGSNTSTYLISGSYFNNEGVVIKNNFQRGSLRLNTRTTKGRVTFGENMMLSHSVNRAPSEGNPFYDGPQMLPVIPIQSNLLRDPSQSGDNPEGYGVGNNNAITYAWNPVAFSNLTSRISNFSRLTGNGYLDVKIFPWLSYRFNAGADVSFDNHATLRKQGRWAYVQSYVNANVFEDRSRFYSLLFENTLNFNKNFGRHAINGVVGISDQQFNRDGSSSGRNGLLQVNGQYFTTISSASGTPVAFGGITKNRILGYLGRVNYNYNDKYLLTLTGRFDQDSRFSEDYRNGFFPSAAATWRISREDFFDVSWISDLRLRASYGKLGVVTVGPWENVGFINNNPRVVFGSGQNIQLGATQGTLANPDLHWEERLSSNIGFEAGLLNNRVTFTLDAYRNRSSDVLVRLPVAGYLGSRRPFTGSVDPYVNAASIQNKGIEASITYRENAGPFKYDVSFNATTIRNKVLDVGNRGAGIDYIQTGLTRSQVGQPVGQWYLIHAMGLFQSQDEVTSHKNKAGVVIQPNAKPGDIRYQDYNDDGKITDDDRQFVGSPWPKLQTGAQFNASYKGFTFNLQLVGIFGYQLYSDVYRILESGQSTNFLKDYSPWTTNNRNTDDSRLGLGSDLGITDNIRGGTDRWLSDAGYLRVRNLELGYQLPESLIRKAQFSNARVFISGQNLLTITDYVGLDPDATGAGILERGFDNGNWPASRIFTVGLNIEF
ncbi:MAG TPA: TonB-dependent receptor [Chitinophagaceae bacterium]|nr:TonB-dependent receptor [Chitinophagaceae bacterium]